jgi:hypothetical protein
MITRYFAAGNSLLRPYRALKKSAIEAKRWRCLSCIKRPKSGGANTANSSGSQLGSDHFAYPANSPSIS